MIDSDDVLLVRPVDDRSGFPIRPAIVGAGAEPLALLQTETSPNTYPALRVRTGVHVFVWFARFTGQQEYLDHRQRLARSTEWTEVVLPELSKRLSLPPEHLRLAPTARSLLR